MDLAADLGHALRVSTLMPEDRSAHPGVGDDRGSDRPGVGPLHQDGHRGGDGTDELIVLDADLPPQTSESRLSGMQEMSTINRAVGMLIDQGHHPDDAHSVLRRHAAAAGVDTHVYAAQLLRR